MGALEFQLVLLRRMADFQPELVEEAVRKLGTTTTAMREANRRWQAMARGGRGSGGPVRRFTTVLGPAPSRRDITAGGMSCEARQWPVPLWPDLRFEVVTAPGGALVQEWLVRAPRVPVPPLRGVDDLRPWSFVIDDVARALPSTPLEGTAPSRWRLLLTDSGGGRHLADFTWGLLQEVTPVTPAD
ncbi:hypothetical protein [Nocardiopsis lucentensis]|uniref:hypothetical protein n=1 Tax=Nocardiopsis lucentensis TaxID=53441 RepID=UPI000345A8D9|nr:hypothetical protein [Nocardiopsis lucentensis]